MIAKIRNIKKTEIPKIGNFKTIQAQTIAPKMIANDWRGFSLIFLIFFFIAIFSRCDRVSTNRNTGGADTVNIPI
jgi:hypothetical protein